LRGASARVDFCRYGRISGTVPVIFILG